MKLIKRKDGDSYTLGTEKDKGLIKVWGGACSDDPDFDPARTTRMIEKMEEAIIELKHVNTFIEGGHANCLSRNGDNAKRRQSILDYIENGEEEEMVTLKMSRKTAEEINLAVPTKGR